MGDANPLHGATPVRDPERRLQDLKEEFVDRMAFAFVWVAAMAVVLSLWRMSSTGWVPSYLYVWVIAAIFVGVVQLRKRLSMRVKCTIFLLLLFSASVQGLPSFGIASSALLWMPLLIFVSAVTFSQRTTYLLLGLCTSVLTGWAYAFSYLHYSPLVDLHAYTHYPSAWANLIIVLLGGCTTIAWACGKFVESIYDLYKEAAEQRNRMEHLATHDRLTGLPQMALAVDRYEIAANHARRDEKHLAVMCLDLDGFKAINDTHGHDAGDFVLKEVAVRLKASVRDGDTVARIGGDEFVILITAVTHAETIADIAEAIMVSVAQAMTYQGQQLSVGASVGISVFPDDAQDFITLRKLADRAMYTRKRSRKAAQPNLQ